MIPSFYPQTLRTPIQTELNKKERSIVYDKTKLLLQKFKNPALMNIYEITNELQNRIDYLDTTYTDFEQLPGKHASLHEKIAYTTEINRVRMLEIALRDKKENEIKKG